jgi:hypothetical protein
MRQKLRLGAFVSSLSLGGIKLSQSPELTEICVPSHRKSSSFLVTTNKALSPFHQKAESANKSHTEDSVELTQTLDVCGAMKWGSERISYLYSLNTLGGKCSITFLLQIKGHEIHYYMVLKKSKHVTQFLTFDVITIKCSL